MAAVLAPASRAAAGASAVARVAPSCETARHTPSAASIAALGAGRARTSARRSGAAAPAVSAATATAACSEVPHPVTVTGRADAGADAISSPIDEAAGDGLPSICSARAGCAAIISCITHGGPERSSG